MNSLRVCDLFSELESYCQRTGLSSDSHVLYTMLRHLMGTNVVRGNERAMVVLNRRQAIYQQLVDFGCMEKDVIFLQEAFDQISKHLECEETDTEDEAEDEGEEDEDYTDNDSLPDLIDDDDDDDDDSNTDDDRATGLDSMAVCNLFSVLDKHLENSSPGTKRLHYDMLRELLVAKVVHGNDNADGLFNKGKEIYDTLKSAGYSEKSIQSFHDVLNELGNHLDHNEDDTGTDSDYETDDSESDDEEESESDDTEEHKKQQLAWCRIHHRNGVSTIGRKN